MARRSARGRRRPYLALGELYRRWRHGDHALAIAELGSTVVQAGGTSFEVEQAPVEEIFYNPKHPYTKALLRSIPRLGKKSRDRLESIKGMAPADAAPFVGKMSQDLSVTLDKPGIYRGQCAELCGRDHAFMPIVVDARKKEDFDAWISEKAAQQKSAAAPAGAETTPTANAPAAVAPPTAAATPDAAKVTLASANAH